MTDLPTDLHSVPTSLGVSLRLDGDDLVASLAPPPTVCERGTLPMSVLVYLADVVAGLDVDTDPEAWTFTSDLTVRAPLVAPPSLVEARSLTLRAGKRSITCEVPLVVSGVSWGSAMVGFARVPWRRGDPPKPVFDVADVIQHWEDTVPLQSSLRDAVGVEVLDPAVGVVTVELRPELANPAGAMQGAMVAHLGEVAAEELADHHLGDGPGRPARPYVVTDLEIRFLAQNRVSPITSRAWFVGPPSEGLIRVDLVDADAKRTTSILARVQQSPG